MSMKKMEEEVDMLGKENSSSLTPPPCIDLAEKPNKSSLPPMNTSTPPSLPPPVSFKPPAQPQASSSYVPPPPQAGHFSPRQEEDICSILHLHSTSCPPGYLPTWQKDSSHHSSTEHLPFPL